IYALSDESGSTMATRFDNEDVATELESALIVSEYSLKTPLQLNGGASFFFGKSGFISADVGYIDYRGSRFNARDFSMSEDNQEIMSTYRPAMNVKLGGEYRYEIFRLRAGAGYYGDPYENNSQINRSRLNFSVGAGLRLPSFYADFAVINDRFNAFYSPYESTISGTPTTEISNSNTRALVTIGFNF
ncbi:MAG: long-chain fatty acid transporter, partial [Bacteroidota bacterium]|nr:long-chain fatty acid transporter [Bacteroidota bacterium]